MKSRVIAIFEGEMMTVELIHLGYKWYCTNCLCWNEIDRALSEVECEDCGKKYKAKLEDE